MLNEHEQRRAVVAEMHLRRWPSLVAPCRIVQFVRVVAETEREDELAVVGAFVADQPTAGLRNLEGALSSNISFSWERHSEASTLTLFITPTDDVSGVDEVMAWALRLPGKVIRATRLVVVDTVEAAQVVLAGSGFSEDDLVTCDISAEQTDSGARIWSDFQLRPDGFGEIIVAAGEMAPATLGRTLQRLQELGNYRNLALLGLPVARAGWIELDRIETELATINAALAWPEATDDDLLKRVFGLWSDLIKEVSGSSYRLNASQAYAAIVEERLAELNIRPCSGHMSLADFTQRRFLPAVRTCAAHSRRAEALVLRMGQVVALLRTRIETRIENQNGQLLASLENSASRQLRLQQVVEGLSVVAISYYAIGIFAKILEGVEQFMPSFHPHLWIGVFAPVVVVGAWWTIRRKKAQILG